MKLFLSYASPDKPVAEGIQLALLGAGHQVFFDEASLPPGSDYNSRIREAIDESDMFIFLISPNSVRRKRYVQTELKLAKAKWPKPWGVVLPVMIARTEHKLIDQYLAAATILEPRGSAPAEIAAEVLALAHKQASPLTTSLDLGKFLAGIARDQEGCLCALSCFAGAVTAYATTTGAARKFRGDTVSPEDTSAAVYLCSLVTQVRTFAKLAVRPAGAVADHERENHLLLVGSSLTNKETAWALSRDTARYRFTLPGEGDFGIVYQARHPADSTKSWFANDADPTLDPEYEAGKTTHIDYGIVERLKWKSFDIFVLAGLGPVGTQGAAYYLRQEWRTLYDAYGDRPFGLVLRFGGGATRGAFNEPTVVHRTDPTDPQRSTEAPFG